jgi:hypothetical protein
MVKGNNLCKTQGHTWRITSVVGWFGCVRERCRVYGHCPGCLGFVSQSFDIVFCTRHISTALPISAYPLHFASESAPLQTSHDQLSFW